MATSGVIVAMAKGSAVSVNGTRLFKAAFECQEIADPEDLTNFESQGFDEGDFSIYRLEWTVEGWFVLNAGHVPTSVTPGFYPRPDLPNVRLYTNLALGLNYYMPYARVFQGGSVARVRNAVQFRANGRSQGSYQRPG